jgi:hypothetical protein
MSLITLIKAHTHAGELHAVGKEIEVFAHDAEWLVERGIAKLRGASSKSAAAAQAPARAAETQPSVQADTPANTTGV